MSNAICIIGAGTMGSGIAQAAAQSGTEVLLYDFDESILEKAKTTIESNLEYLVSKQKISAEEKKIIFKKITFSNKINDCKADIIIEAIIEKAEAKISLFNQLASINKSDTIFASNTSSLSIIEIQAKIKNPE